MLKKLYIIVTAVFISASAFAQTNDSIQKAKADSIQAALEDAKKPVMDPWNGNLLIDQQTATLARKGGLEFVIHHRFTGMGNGFKDVFGLYGAANIRLGLNYGLSNRIMIGYGYEKNAKMHEFMLKAKLLEQNRGGSMPVSVFFNGNVCLSAMDTTYFGADYKLADRFSYFSQLIVSRKFCDDFSLQVAASYSHFNKVEGFKTQTMTDSTVTITYMPKFQNDVFGISAGARYHVHNAFSLIAAYDQGILMSAQTEFQEKPKPNTAFGFEINTNTHTFQMFMSTYRGIISQQNFVKNQADFHHLPQVMLGFNVTVRF